METCQSLSGGRAKRSIFLAITMLVLSVLSCDLSGQVSTAPTPSVPVAVASVVPTQPAVAPTVVASVAPTRMGGGTGRIAFVTGRDSPAVRAAIYLMNADGSQPISLFSSPADIWQMAWAPDGSRIAFATNRDGHSEIYVMNANGGYPTRLTDHPAGSDYPAWSPDGTRIAFESPRDGKWRIYVMNVDGSQVTQLANDHPRDDGAPDWSPDGKRIAFHTNRDGNYEIYVMNADGSQLVRLTNTAKDQLLPKWSPDGTRIAFVSTRDGNMEIYVMNADGSQQTRLTRTAAVDTYPAWSSDGTLIYFQSERDGNSQVYAMKADGSQQIRISSNAAWEGLTAWQPQEASADALKTPPVSAITPWPTYTPTATPTITPTRTLLPQTPLPPGALSQTSDISGVWDSDLGQVTIALWKSQDNRLFPVTGSWIRKDGNKGIINSGTFDPQGGLLEISYSQPWNNIEGTAQFNLSADGKTLTGTWKEPTGQGNWIMQRSTAPTAPVPSSGTAAATVGAQPTNTPAPPTPTPTITPAPPTATPSIPPGMYVTNLRTEPAVLGASMDAGFYVTFLNATNASQQYRWNVYVFRADSPKNSFGEASAQLTTIPVGTVEQKALGSWRLGAGTCGSYFARVAWLDAGNNRTYFSKPDGGTFEYYFTVCP